MGITIPILVAKSLRFRNNDLPKVTKLVDERM